MTLPTPRDELLTLVLRNLLATETDRALLVEKIWAELTPDQRQEVAALLVGEVHAQAKELVRPHMIYNTGGSRFVGFGVELVRKLVQREMESLGLVEEIRTRLRDEREKIVEDALLFLRGILLEALEQELEQFLGEDFGDLRTRAREIFRARLRPPEGRR